jgi:hypothetical protein
MRKLFFFNVGFLFLVLTACQKEINIAKDDLQTLGTSARDLLSADRYTSLTVEIGYMPGLAPDNASIQHLTTFLNTYIHKPGGIKILTTPLAATDKKALSISELVLLEKRSRSVFTLGASLAVYILIVDAGYADNANTLALSYWNTSTCLFGKKIQANSGGAGQVSRTLLVTTLLEHEFGHLMGLVDQGSPMQNDHKDADHGAHCINPSCLMYHAVETTGIDGTGTVPELDAQCAADLKANGGK